jgi:hypothetical protein
LLVGVLAAGPAHARTRVDPDPITGKARQAPRAPAPKAKPLPGPKSMLFPVVGPVRYTDDFGDARAQGSHQGNDIMAAKKSIAVAVEPGKVKFWTTSAAAGCMLYLYGESGTTYLYIHLNNDLTAKNDNRGKCVAGTSYAKGLTSGARVDAGQPIGYVGDSGDADGIAAHLHFEVHPNGKGAVDPYPYLRRAKPLLFAAKRGTLVSLSLQGKVTATAEGELQIKVDVVRVSTGLRVSKLARMVALNVVPGSPVDALTGLPVAASALSKLAGAKTVTVWTPEAPATLDAMLGSPGALDAARIQVA